MRTVKVSLMIGSGAELMDTTITAFADCQRDKFYFAVYREGDDEIVLSAEYASEVEAESAARLLLDKAAGNA